MVADPAEHRHGVIRCSQLWSTGAMAPVDAILPAPFEHGMFGNDDAAVDDAGQVRQLLDLDDPARPVGHAVIVTADRHEPVMADPPLELQDGTEAMLRQSLQFCLFSSAKASVTTRWVVPCTRTLATVSSQSMSWALRSSMLRKDRPRKKSSRI